MKLEDVIRIPVKFSEIDSMGRAWHGSYIKYMEDGREAFGRHFSGIGYADMVKAGILAPIIDVHVKYYGPLELNDVAVIRTTYVPKLGARLDFRYEIRRERDDALCCRASTIQLFIDQKQQLMLEEPQYFIDWKQRYGVVID